MKILSFLKSADNSIEKIYRFYQKFLNLPILFGYVRHLEASIFFISENGVSRAIWTSSCGQAATLMRFQTYPKITLSTVLFLAKKVSLKHFLTEHIARNDYLLVED